MIIKDELWHYGVLGMRWGVRKDPEKAYTRAVKKLSRLQKKHDKNRKTLQRATENLDNARKNHGIKYLQVDPSGRTQGVKYTKRELKSMVNNASKAQKAYERSWTKTHRWATAMYDEFSKVNINDKKFVNDLLMYKKQYADYVASIKFDEYATEDERYK